MITRSQDFVEADVAYEPLDDAPDYPHFENYPPLEVDLVQFFYAATESAPLLYHFDLGNPPDFPTVAPSIRLCSSRLRDAIERLKAPDDVIHWAPAVLRRRGDARDFRYWGMLFPMAVDVRYYSWFDRLRKRGSRIPYVLDSRKIVGRRVFSHNDVLWLYMHRDVAEALQSMRISNMVFRPVRVHW